MVKSIAYLAILLLGIVIGILRWKRQETTELDEDTDCLSETNWKCPICEETVPPTFGKCWNCQTQRS